MSFLTTTQLLAHKMEAVAGTGYTNIETTPVNVRVRELDFSIETEKDDENSKYLTGDYAGNDESIIGKKTGSASYSIKLAPGTVTGSSGNYVHNLTYSGYLENAGLQYTGVNTGVNSTSGFYVFSPSSTKAQATATVARIVRDDTVAVSGYMVQSLAGAMSNLTVSAEGVGMPFKMAFETQGKVLEVKDVANATVAGFNESSVMRTVADKFLNTTVKITALDLNGVLGEVETFCVNTFTFETGNELTPIECQDDASGIKNYIITAMNPTITIDPLLKTLADFNFWTALNSEKFYRVEIISNYAAILIPRAQILNSNITDANGFLRNELSLRALRNIYKVNYDGTIGTGTADAMYYLTIKTKFSDY